jgi:ankyrin repeat protein
MAINNGMLELAEKIIETNSEKLIGFINKENNTSLLIAISKQFWDIATKLIKTGFSKPEHVNNEGDTALLLVMHFGELNIAFDLLLNTECNKHHENKDGLTAFQIAQYRNYYEMYNLF